ncbi:MAG: TIGR04255 family protein [Gammaproteobacteria bacterium]|nr:TIGR04255 family protein [Gammaproteobacteria bacterium]
MSAKVTYKKAPLIELIVEIRWTVQVLGLPGGPPIVSGSSSVFDIWFHGLAGALRADGFLELERLVPHDSPVFAYQPVFRFKKPEVPFPIYQFGHGIFTINAGPPNYISWDDFRPQVESGLQALIAHKPAAANVEDFSVASLRYIDAFREELRSGMSNFAFMRDALGVTIGMPAGLLDFAESEDQITPTFALRFPLKEEDKSSLTFQLAVGRIGRAATNDTIMDTTYSVNRSLTVNTDEVLTVLDNAHDVIHGWFTRLTGQLHEKMIPIEQHAK